MARIQKVLQGVKRRFHAPMVLWITVMWIALNGEISWGNGLAGFLIGAGVVLLLPLPDPPIPATATINWTLFGRYLLHWFWQLIRASFEVAWISIRPQKPPQAAIITAPMRVDNELVLALATALYNLQPGGSVTDIDIANRTWTCHLLRADSEAQIAKEIQAIADLEKAMIEIFERS
ncbi:Na+/H+ antiporter subunit E [Corynebacterium caspium]|uniref:Na+/H+ antiporter subunit E n=1 Tax=Corynebacterium caspium TaxID=234828 RepID=UPI00037E570E|nr:Na+/H+ antiporter subunit E [Corynebacterium caspium]WKD58677.1 putative monovalent cation/H+ antiporter subunit E [Corynebacterium caspium DSM 44850]